MATLAEQLRSAPCQFIFLSTVKILHNELEFEQALAIRDLDPHVLHLVEE